MNTTQNVVTIPARAKGLEDPHVKGALVALHAVIANLTLNDAVRAAEALNTPLPEFCGALARMWTTDDTEG